MALKEFLQQLTQASKSMAATNAKLQSQMEQQAEQINTLVKQAAESDWEPATRIGFKRRPDDMLANQAAPGDGLGRCEGDGGAG